MTEKILIQLQLHKKQNELLYRCIREYILLNKPITILKVPNSYSFHIISPYDKNYIFMVTNFPDEEGFAQVQQIDDNISNNFNFKIIQSFDSLLEEIDNFLSQQVIYVKFEPPVLQDFDCVDLNDPEADTN